ncbi:MAG: translesion error-prone DNA polymerase V autoproteolytic subunit [Vampirovibrionales bacterium]|nr:translesion error-prone DNA polymerase V autoproteolytic subunit [Vampirovibrionales bacterium]
MSKTIAHLLTPTLAEASRLDAHACYPVFSTPVSAGFPSPADDAIEAQLNLNQHLIKHPSATFFLRVSGHSMIGAGIHDGDLLIVDRAVEPQDGKIVIAVIDGELTVKRIVQKKGNLYLMPENDDFAPVQVRECAEFSIWGVVTTVIHAV